MNSQPCPSVSLLIILQLFGSSMLPKKACINLPMRMRLIYGNDFQKSRYQIEHYRTQFERQGG